MRLIKLESTDSTMLEARRRLAAGEPTPFTVVAERQTGGVGRLGRPWSSPQGGWWFTVAAPLAAGRQTLRDDIALDIACTVATACEAILTAMLGGGRGAPTPTIKWPNDVMVGDRKLAGVLIELLQTPSGAVALVGVGVNANVDVSYLDPAVRERATSLRALTERDVEPALASTGLAIVSERIARAIGATADPRGVVAALVRPRLWGVGRTVPITLPDGTRVEGSIDGITDDGNLLATIDGEQRTLRSVDQIG